MFSDVTCTYTDVPFVKWLVTKMNQIIFSKVIVELLDKNIDDKRRMYVNSNGFHFLMCKYILIVYIIQGSTQHDYIMHFQSLTI